MAFTDWEIIQTNNTTVNLQSVNPIAGVSSIEMTGVAGFTNLGAAAQLVPDSFLTRGFSRGKIRTLVKFLNLGSATANAAFRAGIFFLADSPNFGSNSGNAYMVSFNATTDTVDIIFNGIAAPTINLLASAAIQDSFGFQVEEVYPLEVEWYASLTEFGGVRIIVRHGTQSDFSDLEDVIDIIDAPGNTTGTGYEGIFMAKDSASFGTPHWMLDNTSIWSIS